MLCQEETEQVLREKVREPDGARVREAVEAEWAAPRWVRATIAFVPNVAIASPISAACRACS